MQNYTTIIFYLVILAAICYFMIFRPQSKQRKERESLMSSLRVRDKILTSGGIYGRITKLKEKTVMIEVADKVELELSRSGIVSVENRDVTAEEGKEG
ncbi:MAG: preprotein translocase subunit YajC [Peptococcaceae bacterium]|nr:preprotein translocase subunit YajC [Peptococcaceae bacterium]